MKSNVLISLKKFCLIKYREKKIAGTGIEFSESLFYLVYFKKEFKYSVNFLIQRKVSLASNHETKTETIMSKR